MRNLPFHKHKLPFKTPCVTVLLHADNCTDAVEFKWVRSACQIPLTSRSVEFLRLTRKSLAILHPDGQQNIVTTVLFDPCLNYCMELPCASPIVLFITETISL